MASPGFTWLHVSDLHFGHGDSKHRSDQVGVTNAIVFDAEAMAKRLGAPDFIFVTGDVAFSGQPDQYRQAKQWLTRLVKAVGGNPKVFVVPGNHDIDRQKAGQFVSASVHETLRKDPTKLDELLADPLQMQAIWPKLQAYADFAKDFAHPAVSHELPFWTVEVPCTLSGKLCVVGLNTALLCLDAKDSTANLRLGRGQVLKAIEEAPRDALLVVLQHHPPEWLLDGNDLAAQLQQRAHIQFSGHVHQQQGVLHVPVLGGSRLQFVAGAGHADANEAGLHAYAWGQLNRQGLAYYSRVWLLDRSAFAPAQLLDTDDFKRDDYAFVERARLPRSIEKWLPSLPADGPVSLPSNALETVPTSPAALPTLPGSAYSPNNAAYYIPYHAKGSHLVGRQEPLAELQRRFHSPGSKHAGRVALFGIGGLGKTQLAAEYCHLHHDSYRGGIYWLDAAQDLAGQLTALCDRAKWLNPDSKHAEKLTVARQRLRSHHDCLIVFDNAEDPAAIKPYLPEPANNSHVLITVRPEPQQGWQAMPLKMLSVDESLGLLQAESDRTASTPAEQDAARAIAKQLDGLPLALELVGAYLKRRPAITWTDCAADLDRRGMAARSLKKWSGFEDESLTRHGADLHAALSLDESLFADSPLLRQLLDLLAWAGAAPMGEGLLRHLLGQPEPGDLIDALDLSAQLRILSIEQDANGQRRFRMHRLVQQVRQQDVARPQGGLLQQQCQHLGDWFEAERVEFASLPAYEAELPHLREYQGYARHVGDWPTVVRLRWLEAYPPYYRGQYGLAHSIVKEAFSLYCDQRIDNPKLIAHLSNDLGSTYQALGQHQEAINLYRQAMNIRREALGENHSETAMSIHNLGTAYSNLSQHQEAIKLHQQALDIRRAVSGEKHPETARVLGSLGAFYSKVGQLSMARSLMQQALDIWREVRGERHPETARAINRLGTTDHALGKNHEALKLQHQALDIQHEVLGEKHPDTANTHQCLSSTYLELRDYLKALQNAKTALAIRIEVLGRKHRATIDSRLAIADCWQALKQGHEALRVILDGLHDAPREAPGHDALKERETALLNTGGRPLQPGFRQPRKGKAKKRRPR